LFYPKIELKSSFLFSSFLVSNKKNFKNNKINIYKKEGIKKVLANTIVATTK